MRPRLHFLTIALIKRWCLLLPLLALATFAQATIRRVNASSTATNPDGSSWANAYKDLQAAINASGNANVDDQIFVSSGSYTPATTATPFSMKPRVYIYGGYNNADAGRDPKKYPTYLNGNGNTVILNIDNGLTPTNSLLDGFTIQAGFANNNSGGGMYNFSSAPKINNVTFRNNTCSNNGGAIYNVNPSGSPVITNCQFLNNTATYGAGIYNDYAQPVITNSVFAGNVATQDGGALETYGSTSAGSTLTLTLVNCVFYNNRAINGVGGGVFTRGTIATVINNTFFNNVCGIAGSAAGLYNYAYGTLTLTNSVFWNNTINGNVADEASLNNSTQTATYNYSQQNISGTNNITGASNPFINNGATAIGADGVWMTADDNLQLSICNGSNAIDKGNNSAISAANYPTDITGATRVAATQIISGNNATKVVDMGAYENQTTITPLQISGLIKNSHMVPSPKEMYPDYILDSVSTVVTDGSFSWQQSTDNATWVAADNSTNSATYNIPAISSSMYYRRVATSPTYCNIGYPSNAIFIRVVQSNGTISGTVRSKNGVGVKGITIQAVRLGTNTSGSPAGYTYTTVTGNDGTYTITPVYYGNPGNNLAADSFTVSPIKTGHTFDFTSLQKKLSTTAPNVANVNFTDLTVYSIVGGTSQFCKNCITPLGDTTTGVGCPLDSVQMFSNGNYFSTSSFLDTGTNQFAHGRYAITITDPTVSNGSGIKIKPSFNGHLFSPVDSSVVVVSNVKNVNFVDISTHTISGRLAADCNDYIGSATLEFTDVLPDDVNGARPSCFKKRVKTDENGYYSITLPARNYKVQVFSFTPATAFGSITYVDPLTLMTFIDTMPNSVLTRDITTHDTTLNLIYHRPPVLKLVAGLDTLCNGTNRGFALFNQGFTDSFTLKVYQGSPLLKGGVGCLVEDNTNYVKVFTSIPSTDASNVELDYFPNDTGVVVRLTGGTPNIISPYNKTLSVSYTDIYNRPAANFNKTVVVLGARADAATFTTVSPQIPLLVLHDPPGDGSFSFQQKDQTTKTAFRIYTGQSSSVNPWIEAKIGTDITTGIGVEEENSVWGSVNETINITSANTTANETILTSTVSSAYKTSADPSVIGNSGDVYVGTALNLIYSVATVVKYDSCKIKTSRQLILANKGFSTQYIYTEKLIKNTIIPSLQKIATSTGNATQAQKDSSFKQIAVWQQILDANAYNKKNAVFDQNISFGGGAGAATFSTTSGISQVSTIEFSMEIEKSIATELGFEVAGTGVKGGVIVNFKMESGASTSTTLTNQTTTSYTLYDKNSKDFYSVDVKKDQVYGTPVFALAAGTASCPATEGAQSLDQAQLAIASPIVSGIPANGTGTFIMKLGNLSQDTDPRIYKLYFDQSSNPDGAVIKIGGSPVVGNLGTDYSVGFNGQTSLTVTVDKAASSNVYSYHNLRFFVTDDCNGINSGDTLASNTISAYFTSPCSNISMTAPTNNWVLNQAANNQLPILMTGYDVASLTSVSLEYSAAGTSNWTTGFTKTSAELNTNGIGGTLVNWNVAGLVDGIYAIRIKLVCAQGIVYSTTATGIIDRVSPALFGIPQPTDDNYVTGDVISFSYTENLMVNNLNNGQVTMTRLSNKQAVPITVSGYGNTIQIVPNSSIAGFVGDSMRVIVTNMTDIYGNIKTTADTTKFIIGTSIVGTGNKAVSLAISQPTIAKNAAGTMDYRFSLPAALPYDVSVNFTVSGTALAGIDYTTTDTFNIAYPKPPVYPLPSSFNGSQGSITIPAGATQAVKRIKPTNNTNASSNKTLTVNLANGGDYVIGAVNSITGTITNTAVLPLQLLSFTGQLTDEKTLMQWKTAKEVNTSYFVVERSVDGVIFNSIGQVTANGTGNNSYSYVDDSPADGTNFYRLKMVDKDANYTYSSIINVVKLTDAFKIISFSPSPLSGSSATLKVVTGKVSKLRFTMVDILGRMITLPEYTTAAGTNNVPLTLVDLVAGIYTIYATDGLRKSNAVKFLKQ